VDVIEVDPYLNVHVDDAKVINDVFVKEIVILPF
jgi:small nuclear ribonucleoprotein (snRNP)-like protein